MQIHYNKIGQTHSSTIKRASIVVSGVDDDVTNGDIRRRQTTAQTRCLSAPSDDERRRITRVRVSAANYIEVHADLRMTGNDLPVDRVLTDSDLELVRRLELDDRTSKTELLLDG